ncbi:transposase [Tychonema sp. LEGE 06208]|uniref:IS110 family transposase n=1 Tax=Tychonema sp. LEGE 06208 TaxID=1828663 RepID=UPI00187E67E4|nr:transposase [Tychonema sp. LEGE 06208]MBE9164195.1 transposase [Tychonema sp. LEGE 06208]
MFKVIGIDVSAHRVDVVLLENFPQIALRDFYLSPEFEKVHAVYEVTELDNLLVKVGDSPAVAILEGTGTYSYYWRKHLKKNGIFVLTADQGMVKSTRRSLGGTDNKDDPFDALVMCELYRRHYLDVYDRRFWVKELDPKIEQMRRALLDLKTTTRKQTSFINSIKGRLAWEYPARATVKSQRANGSLDVGKPPAFWAWLAGRGDFLSKSILSRFNNHYEKEQKCDRANISEMTRQFASSVCDLHDTEAQIELRLTNLLFDSDFDRYHRVFDRFSFGYRERGWILSRIFPFEDFLCLPKKRALRRFRQACGLGKIEKSSGQMRAGGGGGKWTGCANTRSTLWTYINCRIEPQKLKGQSYTALQLELREYFIGRAFEADGTKKRGGRLADARNASCRKLADLVFRELYNEMK